MLNASRILWFDDVSLADVSLVGGKNAALGEMHRNLTQLGINVPNGFIVTTAAYDYFLEANNLREKIRDILKDLDTKNTRQLAQKGKLVREAIRRGAVPKDLADKIKDAYAKLTELYKDPADPRHSLTGVDVAVRSSASAEDLPGASFAGQQETYLNVSGLDRLLDATRNCFASLFTDRAISYRADKGFDHLSIGLSVGVQKMARSDLAGSGVAFTLDPDTGFDGVIVINATYGLGELIVQGKVIPDEWIFFKPTLAKGFRAIISRTFGEKRIKLVYAPQGGIAPANVPLPDQKRFVLTDDEALMLANWCQKIEDFFSEKYGRKQPMDIEWAKDGKTSELFIVQARPETVHSSKSKNVWEEFSLKRLEMRDSKLEILAKGIAVGTKIAAGKARVIKTASGIHEFQPGEVLVTEITDPDWEPIMKIASGIVTDKGGRTSHAAIVSRELGVACIVGTGNGTTAIKTGCEATLDCSSGGEGVVYSGILPFEATKHDLGKIPETKTAFMVNVGTPDEAFKNHFLPVKGVGLAREEFIIASGIKIHPKALLEYQKIKNQISKAKDKEQKTLATIVAEIERLTEGYEDKAQFYVDKLAEGIAKIAAAFWPYQVIVRFSDFKTNEYRNLLGGELYEPHEENPMLGWRGAARYHDDAFKDAFALEVKALVKAREGFGLVNIVPMVPMVRTVEEGKKVLDIIESVGLKRDMVHNASCRKHVEECPHTRIYMMCEIPVNVLLADEFLELFDGFSIGSNDLTQFTLGLDRDSGIVTKIGNETNEAVKELVRQAIRKCNEKGKYVGICGQAPSDIPGYAKFLVDEGIQSISLNPDTVIKTILEAGKE